MYDVYTYIINKHIRAHRVCLRLHVVTPSELLVICRME